jgi:hypothetical protein
MTDFLHKRTAHRASHTFQGEEELEQFFTNREEVRRYFEQLIHSEEIAKRLMVIHGVGAVGKSTLLLWYRLYCHKHRVPVALVFGEEAPSVDIVLGDWARDLHSSDVTLKTFAALVERYHAIDERIKVQRANDSATDVAGESATAWLQGFLSPEDLSFYGDPSAQLTDAFLADLAEVTAHQRLVLVIDTFEQMTTLSDWVRDLARRLPKNLILVIAGQACPEWSGSWLGWMRHAEIIELKELVPDDMRRLVRRYYQYINGGEPEPSQVEAVVKFAHGLPIAAQTAVELWVTYGPKNFEDIEVQVVTDIVDRLLNMIPQKRRRVFEVAAVLRFFNADSLRALLDKDEDDPENLYAELRRLPFVHARREGLAVHDTVREMINRGLFRSSPARFYRLHTLAASYYEERLKILIDADPERHTLEWLYHQICADKKIGTERFQERAEDLARNQMLSRLNALLNDVSRYKPPEENDSLALWWKYYQGRLSHLQGKLAEAETAYRVVADNPHAEKKLQAYALCDWAYIWARPERLSRPQGMQTALSMIERSRALAPQDSKLIFNLATMRGIANYRCAWQEGINYTLQQRAWFAERADIYGLIETSYHLEANYALQGDWQKAISIRSQARHELAKVPSNPYLHARIAGCVTWAFVWAGKYKQAEQAAAEALAFARQANIKDRTGQRCMDLSYAIGMRGDYRRAEELFRECLGVLQELGPDYQGSVADALGYWGAILIKKQEWDRAHDCLTSSLRIKRTISNDMGTPELLMWLGELHEAQAHWPVAERFYQELRDDYRHVNRRNFEAGALTGLARVKHAQGDYAAAQMYLTDAEKLAQRYQYNDYLASLCLTQGHMAWDGHNLEWGIGFDAALRYYQHALMYALRYNHFLLDEVLWGGGVGTPLDPIIPHCLKQGEAGREMLSRLLNWWSVGLLITERDFMIEDAEDNPAGLEGVPSIAEGMLIAEAEQIVRERELSEGLSQAKVVAHIQEALKGSSSRI